MIDRSSCTHLCPLCSFSSLVDSCLHSASIIHTCVIGVAALFCRRGILSFFSSFVCLFAFLALLCVCLVCLNSCLRLVHHQFFHRLLHVFYNSLFVFIDLPACRDPVLFSVDSLMMRLPSLFSYGLLLDLFFCFRSLSGPPFLSVRAARRIRGLMPGRLGPVAMGNSPFRCGCSAMSGHRCSLEMH